MKKKVKRALFFLFYGIIKTLEGENVFERITIVLFKSHFTAKYIAEKMYKTLFYFFIMLVIALLPTICLFKDGVVISKNEYSLMEEAIRSSNGSLISQNGTIINDNFYISTSLYNYAFGYDDYNTQKFNVIIEDGHFNIYTYGIRVARGNIELDDLKIDKDASSKEISLLTSKLYNVVYENSLNIISAYVVVNSLIFILKVILFVVIFYFLGNLINPMIKGRFRWTIVLYAMFPYLLFNAFAGFLGYEFLSAIGLLYTYFVYSKALKAIVKIEVKKGE